MTLYPKLILDALATVRYPGMVLSLGMAVDANVLIYERTKEELRAGKGTKQRFFQITKF